MWSSFHECSTPFGITASRHWRQRPGPTRLPGAQRLSASLLTSRAVVADADVVASKCSTPFGITAFVTDRNPISVIHSMVCSTPFGITAFVTMPLCRPGLPDPLGCSTPFGITAFVTGDGSMWLPSDATVLNAFRHHCLRHSASLASISAKPCAQRLSASLLSSPPVSLALIPHQLTTPPFMHAAIGMSGITCSAPAWNGDLLSLQHLDNPSFTPPSRTFRFVKEL